MYFRIPSQFNTGQRAFLREIYSEIISADDGCISSTDCLNMSSTLDVKLSITDADIFLKYLSKENWLLIKVRNFYHLSLEIVNFFKN